MRVVLWAHSFWMGERGMREDVEAQGISSVGIDEVREMLNEVKVLVTECAKGVTELVGIPLKAAEKDLRGVFSKINKQWSESIRGGARSRSRASRRIEERGGERVCYQAINEDHLLECEKVEEVSQERVIIRWVVSLHFRSVRDGFLWDFSGVYDPQSREENRLWYLIANFNVVVAAWERTRDNALAGDMDDFSHFIQEATLEDLGGKFGGSSSGYSVSGGLHGVGLSVVNALSEALEISVWRDGKEYQQKYCRGKPVTDLICHSLPPESNDCQGTSIRFWPDREVFTTTITFDYNTIASRIRELAFLNP
ncbi:hypothetical protein Taro_033662, partial [Colocasia esculenta]|nr:hypothetical protein [Colocasia esculenta]